MAKDATKLELDVAKRQKTYPLAVGINPARRLLPVCVYPAARQMYSLSNTMLLFFIIFAKHSEDTIFY